MENVDCTITNEPKEVLDVICPKDGVIDLSAVAVSEKAKMSWKPMSEEARKYMEWVIAEFEKYEDAIPFRLAERELIELVKYWERMAIDIEFHFFKTRFIAPSDEGELTIANKRIDQIADIIGIDGTRQACIEAREAYGTQCNAPKKWKAFRDDAKAHGAIA